MIIKRKLYSLRTAPPIAKKVGRAVAKTMIPINTGIEHAKNLFYKATWGGNNQMLDARHKIALRQIKGKSLRAGVKAGHVVENPGKAFLDATEKVVGAADTQIIPAAKSITALAIAPHNPALGAGILALPATPVGVAVSGALKSTSPKYNNFIGGIGKRARNFMSRATGITDTSHTLQAIQERKRIRS